MELILVGQPNCGKSTIFNSVIGYRSISSNFPGVTVSYTRGEIEYNDERVRVIDIPGTYSLLACDEAETEAVRYLYNLPDDAVLVNIIDSSVLSRSLELTLQLMELQRPMIVVLNMSDEAERKGIDTSVELLSSILGVPVLKSIGHKGIGVADIFKEACRAGNESIIPKTMAPPNDIEPSIQKIERFIATKALPAGWNSRFTAIRLIEHDTLVEEAIQRVLSKHEWKGIKEITESLDRRHPSGGEGFMSSFRHNAAFTIFEKTTRVHQVKSKDVRVIIDSVLMHPIYGFLFMALLLYGAFWTISSFAELVDPIIVSIFDWLYQHFITSPGGTSFIDTVAKGFFEGIGGGISIAVSFLVPFFIFLAFLEDTGYLSRIAFLTDNLMHRIGLHGLSVVPLILGYGCNVPAIFATRILKSPRDRIITATLATLVPCSARMVIILGIVGALFSMKAVVLIYLSNILILGIVGKILSLSMPAVSPGLLMEVPKYHLPTIKDLTAKTWLRLKEFVYIAIPLLVAGSIVLELINKYSFSAMINRLLSPFTVGILGLPAAAGVVLLFGIMRKELALLLLLAAMGVHHANSLLTVMTPVQVYSFTVFSSFYIPCLATVVAMAKVFNWRSAILISLMTFCLAILLTLMVRGIFFLFF